MRRHRLLGFLRWLCRVGERSCRCHSTVSSGSSGCRQPHSLRMQDGAAWQCFHVEHWPQNPGPVPFMFTQQLYDIIQMGVRESWFFVLAATTVC